MSYGKFLEVFTNLLALVASQKRLWQQQETFKDAEHLPKMVGDFKEFGQFCLRFLENWHDFREIVTTTLTPVSMYAGGWVLRSITDEESIIFAKYSSKGVLLTDIQISRQLCGCFLYEEKIYKTEGFKLKAISIERCYISSR